MRTTALIEVNEIFGPTFQGEGTAAGQHCVFLRVAQCNLECRWCDTPFTWAYTREKASRHDSGVLWSRMEQARLMPPSMVIDGLLDVWNVQDSPTIVVISGGEPMMQQLALVPVMRQLVSWSNRIHIETAGTIGPVDSFDEWVAQYNVSPKLHHSGNRHPKRFKPLVLKRFVDDYKAQFKFVVTAPEDLVEVDQIVEQINLAPHRVMIMPEGTTLERNLAVAATVEEGVKARGWGLTLRTHVALWGDERGR